MLPIGPLMIEHRLIERMIHLMDKELQKIMLTGVITAKKKTSFSGNWLKNNF
jgi:hypothetical protein